MRLNKRIYALVPTSAQKRVPWRRFLIEPAEFGQAMRQGQSSVALPGCLLEYM
jgi:hypothetical protein